MNRSSRNKKMEPLTEDEILIDAVCERRPLWDNSLDAIERTKLKKNALWSEISIVMGGRKTPTTARKRWQYLRDCYVKAKRKMQTHVGGVETGIPVRSSFRYYQRMQFLQSVLDPQDTINSLPETLYNSNGQSPLLNDMGAAPELNPQPGCSYIKTEHNYRSPSEASSLGNVRLRTNSSTSSSTSATPKKRSADISELEIEFLKYFKEAQPRRDAVDSFLEQLGEILRRLPYIQRRNFQLRILTQAIEEEDKMINESNNEIFYNS